MSHHDQFVWSEAEKERLQACTTDTEMRSAFPDHKLQTLKRRKREWGEASAIDAETGLNTLLTLLDDAGIDPADIGRVSKLRISNWEAMHKDDAGNAIVTPLTGTEVVLSPKWAEGPQWPVVQPAAPTVIKPTRARSVTTRKKWKTAVILPDPQIGFRRDLTTAALDPFHDDRAMDIALQVIDYVSADTIINLGDMLDLAPFGRWVQEPGFALTVQPSLDRGNTFLADQRATAPDADIRLIEGNHDRRAQNAIMQNAMAAFGLRRANTPPTDWPVLSIPNLLKLDELEVEYVPGYPAGITWINDRIACIHGHKVRSSGSTAALVLDDERVSTIFGHVHRIERLDKTKRVREGFRTTTAISPGCLCRIDGTVPGVKGAVDPLGRPVASFENWQQGIAVVTYKDGDSPFHVDTVPIHEHGAFFSQQLFTAA